MRALPVPRRSRRTALVREPRPLSVGRRTQALAVVAATTTGAVLLAELVAVWRESETPAEAEAGVALPPDVPLGHTVEVAVAGYRGGTAREHALLNLLLSFSATFAAARVSTAVIRRRGTFGPFRNVRLGDDHIHHFVPGIAMAFLAGAASIISPDERLDSLLALPFGVGMALTLDESALLLKLDDVYWTEEGVVSVQITLATAAVLSALALTLRVLRRGEAEIQQAESAG